MLGQRKIKKRMKKLKNRESLKKKRIKTTSERIEIIKGKRKKFKKT